MNKWLNSPVNGYIEKFGVSTKPVIYEVGSRDGHDGVELAQRIYAGEPHKVFGSSEIVLFECNPPHIRAIQQNYPQVTLVTKAVSDKPGTAEFLQIHGDKNYMGSSSLDLDRTDYSWVKQTSTISVEVTTLAKIIEELGHQSSDIDIMKIDIEGYTMEALRGLGKYLRNVKVFHLETEVEGKARKETNLDIALFMEQKGYKCIGLDYEWPPSIQDQTWVRL